MPLRTLDYQPVGEIRAENAIGFIHPDDRKYGVLAAGVQGVGKTAALLRLFANDVLDPRAAQIVMDPKMELVERCFEVIPPDCGKEVWYLDLGNPLFGMTPLRMHGDSDFGTEAAAVAESVVAALLAISPGQIFQSSRRYLYHAVIGALAIAHEHPQLHHGMFEHVHGLLLPKGPGEALRQVAAQACARLGLEQTAFFYTQELPGELQIAGHQAAARLDPPRNKIDGIVGVPPLKRFFQHPQDVSMRDLVERRAILLVNGNMARIGEDNAQVCMHFIFQMLHRQMQHQMHLPEAERPRVALIADEAGYLLSRNVVRQIATHRAAGLDVAIGIQYLGQLGAGAESGSVTEEIRKGVTNLLQSRFLFRLSDPRDADEVSRIAMALVSTMTQQDPDSRLYRRVGPEVMLNIENYFCLCSWIASGARISSFIGQTFEMPRPARRWAEEHLARLRAAVGTPPSDFVRTTAQLTDPEQLLAALSGRAQHAADEPGPIEAAEALADEGASPRDQSVDGSSAVPVQRLFTEEPAGRDPHFDSLALRVFGRPYARGEQPDSAAGQPAPASLRELALVDRMSSITKWQEKPPTRQPRLVDVDYAILRLLDRAGILLVPLLARACMPGKAERTVRQKLAKLHDAGLIARGEIDVHDRSPGEGALPSAVRLTAHGFRIGQEREVIDPDKQWRPCEVGARALSVPHDQHVIAWITALTRLLGERVVTDNWRTPRTRHGVIAPPQVGDGRGRHVLTPAELKPPAAGYAFDGAFTPAGPDDRFAELKPDATVEIRIPGQFTFDLLLELTLTAKPSHNQSKFAAYDAFLLGWWREHRRYQHLRGRPVVLFVFASQEALRANAEIADREITGRLGIIGIPTARVVLARAGAHVLRAGGGRPPWDPAVLRVAEAAEVGPRDARAARAGATRGEDASRKLACRAGPDVAARRAAEPRGQHWGGHSDHATDAGCPARRPRPRSRHGMARGTHTNRAGRASRDRRRGQAHGTNCAGRARPPATRRARPSGARTDRATRLHRAGHPDPTRARRKVDEAPPRGADRPPPRARAWWRRGSAALLDHCRGHSHCADSAPARDLPPTSLAAGRGRRTGRGGTPTAGTRVGARAPTRGGHRHGQLAHPPL